jgi:hypothetical protein
LPYESGEFERIRPHQTAFDALGVRDYIWRYPPGSYIQESRFDLGNPELETLYDDDTQGGLQISEAHKDLWIDSWAKYEAAGLQLLAAVRFEDSTRFGLYQEMMETADKAVKGTLMLTVIVETLGERKD